MTPEKALERLQVLCSKKEVCSGQVRKKLQEWSMKNVRDGKDPFPDNAVSAIICRLVEDKFVDDARFAEAYVRDKARFSKWGKVKISYNLRALGISGEVVHCALENNSGLFSEEQLEALLKKKWSMLHNGDAPEKKKEKLLRFALGRGFGYDQIIPVLKRLG